MNVKSVEKKEHSVVVLEVEVGSEEFEAALEKAYRKKKNSLNVPGFRKGKAPRKVIEAMYGASVFYEDAVNEVYPEAYDAAIRQEKLEAVSYPEMEIVDIGKEGFTFKASVTVVPDVKLGQYKGLSAVRPAVEVTEEDIEKEMQPLIDRASRIEAVSRPAAEGDTVVIDFEGFDNGVPFEGGKGEKYNLTIGSGSFVPGFEEQVAGMSADEEKDIDITFPEDYHKELAGKQVVFHVKVHEVKEKKLPEIDDEFAKDVSEFETLQELRDSLKNKILERKTAEADSVFENNLVDMVAEGMEVEVPQIMVDMQSERMLNDFARQIGGQGIQFQDYLNAIGMNFEQVKQQTDEAALSQVRRELALNAVVKAENIEVSEEEIEAEYEKMAKQYSMPVDKMRAAISSIDLSHELRLRKATEMIVKSAVPVSEEAAPKEEKKTKKSSKSKKTEADAETVKDGEAAETKPKKRSMKKTEQE